MALHRVSRIALALVCISPVAAAHVRLTNPPARYPAPASENGAQMKEGPCGVTGDSRTTDASRITTFAPGETITVEFDETIGHPGHFRIAFDDDGQDAFQDPTSFTDIAATPALPILLDGIEDKTENGEYQVTVTLPNVTCENCTLQLIQVMTDKPPFGPGGGSDIYYQCADIVLAGEPTGAGGAGGAAGAGGAGGGAAGSAGDGGGGVSGSPGAGGSGTSSGGTSATAGAGGTAPASGGSGGVSASGGTSSGGAASSGAGGTASAPPAGDSEDDGGCSVKPGGSTSCGAPIGTLLLAAFAWLGRRRGARRAERR